MSLLQSLATDSSISNERDSIGGSRVLESGMYLAKVTLAYISKSSGGALGLVLGLKTESGQDIKQTLWMTSGTAKGCKNYYEDTQNQKNYLPGFILANSICLLTLGKEISELTTEQKVVSVYSPEAKAEVPTKVDMLMDLLGQEIIAALIKQVVDKTKKDENNVYQPTGETKEENELDKFFRAKDKMTTAEIRAQATEPNFYEVWATKWTGKTKEKAKGAGAGGGTAGAPKAGGFAMSGAAAAKKPASSLFA